MAGKFTVIPKDTFDALQLDAGVLLNDKGREIFIAEYQKKLETTIKHPTLNKKVSYTMSFR